MTAEGTTIEKKTLTEEFSVRSKLGKQPHASLQDETLEEEDQTSLYQNALELTEETADEEIPLGEIRTMQEAIDRGVVGESVSESSKITTELLQWSKTKPR